VTLGDYAARLWLPQIKTTVKPSSAERYKQTLRLDLLPTLKDHKVRLLTRRKIKHLLVSKLAEGYSRATVRLMLSTLRLVLSSAVEDDVIKYNPCQRLGRQLNLQASPGSVVNAEQQVKAFTPEQLERFFEATKQSPIPYGPLFWLLALTGLRVGEGVALRWSDIDVADRKLHIQRTLSAGFLSTPKSGRDRLVDLSERAVTMLHRLQLNRADRAKRFKWTTVPEYAFTTRLGEPPSAHRIRVEFADVLKRAGLPAHHSPHSLRHSYATLLLRNGESLKYVKEQLGHATISLTADLYGKWARSEPLRGGPNYLDALARPQTGLKLVQDLT
jgi:integrase